MLWSGGPLYAIVTVICTVLVNATLIGTSYWLLFWVNAYSSEEAVNVACYLGIYAAFIVASIALDGLTTAVYANGAWLAARRLHHQLLQSVMHAPLAWWTSVPVGRVVNRFSRDLNSLDDTLSKVLQYFLGCLARLFFSLGAIASILPAFALPALALCGVGAAAGEMYTRTAVTVKRLVSSSQSPVFSQFADTLAGLIAIAQARALAAGHVGFSLTAATGLSGTILGLVRSMGNLEVELQSFDRVSEYSNLEPEEKDKSESEEIKENAEGDSPGGQGTVRGREGIAILGNWPATGAIEFRNVTVRYNADGLDVLNDVNLKIGAGQRVAIVGRTGSGKSTVSNLVAPSPFSTLQLDLLCSNPGPSSSFPSSVSPTS